MKMDTHVKNLEDEVAKVGQDLIIVDHESSEFLLLAWAGMKDW